MPESFVDIHCHILPGIDDGAKSWDESLAMARLAVADGIKTIVATPHQLGGNGQLSGSAILNQVGELQRRLNESQIPLQILPGADVRIEPDLVQKVQRGEVLSLANRGRHVLLELPHELYLPLEGLLAQLKSAKMIGILSHPERNQGILAQRGVVSKLKSAGCLMQITADSLLGTFGSQVQHFSEWLLYGGFVHFVASDAHGTNARKPQLRDAFSRTASLVGEAAAIALFCDHPHAVALGKGSIERPPTIIRPSRAWRWPWRRAA